MSVRVLYQYPSDNVAGAYATIGVNTGTEDADYPAAYLADGRPGRPAKLTTTAGSWVFDFGAAQRVDLVALGAHNLAAATLEANATNAWGSPDFSAALTISAPSADGHGAPSWRDLTAAAGYASGGFRYWRLVVSGTQPCAVAELWLGATIREAAHGYRYGFTISEHHATIAHETEYLVPLVYALGSRQRRLALSFQATPADAADLLAWYRACRGGGQTAIFVPDADQTDVWWVRQAEDYSETVPYLNSRDVAMTLVEHATGVPL